MASNKQIKISITSALDAAGINATRDQVDAMSRQVAKSMGNAANASKRHWADVKAAWDMGLGAMRTAWNALKTVMASAFHYETQTNQFKTLIGDIDAARAHMADLKALGDTPPFGLEEFAKASRSLMVMTDGALGYKKSLELIGDAAAATGHPVEEMGQAVGRLYAVIRDGQPISRATMQLRNMGVLAPEVAQKLQDMQNAGATNAEIWAAVEDQLKRYNGAMAETEKTGDGLIAAIQTRWDNVVRTFGNALMEDSKGGLDAVAEAAKNLEESGAVELWATKTRDALASVVEGARTVVSALASVFGAAANTIKGFYQSGFQAVGNVVGTIAGGGGIGDALTSGWSGYKQGWVDAFDADGAQAEQDEKRKAEAAKKRRAAAARDEAQAAEREAAERKRIDESLSEAQRKLDEENAKKAAEKRVAEEKKAAEKVAAERAQLDAQEAARRERERQREIAERIRDQQRILVAERSAEADAHSQVAGAESKLQRAWGWYRDKDSMAAQIAEEKADAEARKQYEKDFERLKSRRRDWRKAENLSVDDEAVRRVALAREEKETAEKHLAEIERNTAELAAKLESISAIIERGE